MTQFHLLDRLIGAQRPDLSTEALLRRWSVNRMCMPASCR